MKKTIIIGTGGHSKSVIDSIDTKEIQICGFIDTYKKGNHYGKPIIGSKILDIENYEDYFYFVAIGDIKVRKKWFEEIKNMKLKTINIIDKSAIISPNVKIGTGNFIGKLAIINSEAVIGDNNILNTKCLVEHECRIGNHVHLSTNSTLNGNVVVEDEVFYGSTAVCNGQLRIGHNSIVGSGSVIIKNINPYETVVGVPGRVVKVNNE